MRAAALCVVVAALAANGAVFIGGASAASHWAPQNAAFPTWSADGKQIAFVERPSSNRYRIVRTSSNPGGAVETVLRAEGRCCAQLLWAADGQILFDPSGGLKSVHVPGTKPQRVLLGSCGIDRNSWGCSTMGFFLSANRRYAAAEVTEDPSDPHSSLGVTLVKMRPGRAPIELTTPLPEEESKQRVIDSALAFSPDGEQLVYSRASWDGWSEEGPPALMALKIGSAGSVPLAQSGIPGASLVPNDATQVQWSPDGSWVAYVEPDSTASFQKLEVVPTTGVGAARVLATCNYSSPLGFSWSPTSDLVAYDCEGQSDEEESVEGSQFETVKPDGTDYTDLLGSRKLVYDQVASGGPPRWSPDGSRLLFMAELPLSDVDHVWTVRADGSHLTRRS
jgi:Tol biopolymer transport system component